MAVPPESTTSRPPLLTMVRLAGLDVPVAAGHDRADCRTVEKYRWFHPAENPVDQVFTVYVVKNLMK
jgi:hypothetical protein